MEYTNEVKNMCKVSCGANHGCAPIPSEGKWVYSKEIKEKLKEEIQVTLDMKINATPTYLINGKRYEGIFKYPDLEKIVIELGAIKKQK